MVDDLSAQQRPARFAVVPHNPSAMPLPFERCPLLIEMLAPAGRPEVHQVNCPGAAQLPANGSLRFEMHIQVPADAPAGSNGLFWELDPSGGQAPEAVSRLTVAAPWRQRPPAPRSPVDCADADRDVGDDR